MSGRGPKYSYSKSTKPRGLVSMGNLMEALEEETNAFSSFGNIFGALENVEGEMKAKEMKKVERELKKKEREAKALEKAGLAAAASMPIFAVSSKGRSIKRPKSYKETGSRKGGRRTYKRKANRR